MYAALTIFPVEQFIMRANVQLAGLANSRIRLSELTMLSPDVLNLAQRYEQRGLLQEETQYFIRGGGSVPAEQFDWQPWIESQHKIVSQKTWYEKNIMNFFVRRSDF
jgi:hypothetical protein